MIYLIIFGVLYLLGGFWMAWGVLTFGGGSRWLPKIIEPFVWYFFFPSMLLWIYVLTWWLNR